jgi:hypothetical protein
MKIHGWDELAEYVEETYGAEVNWDEEFFICPECGEPIYKEDYDLDSDEIALGMCPVCGMYLNEEVPVGDSIRAVIKRYLDSNGQADLFNRRGMTIERAIETMMRKNQSVTDFIIDNKTIPDGQHEWSGVIVVSWREGQKMDMMIIYCKSH